MIKQNTPEWLEMRKKYIGASDAPVIMNGGHFKKSPYMLWQEKVGLSGGQEENFAMRYGKENEDKARSAYQLMTGNFVSPEVIFHPEIPYLMASLDGLSADKDMAVEIKNANADDHALAKEGTVPDKYYPQLQHQLECAKLDKIHYFSFHQEDGAIVEIQRDEKYIKKMLKKLEEFWKLVENFEMPELTDLDLREQNEAWAAKAQEVYEHGKLAANYKTLYDKGKKELQEMAGSVPSKGGGFIFKKSIRKGNVIYKNIPEIKGVDLEIFRGTPIEMWRLVYTEEKNECEKLDSTLK